MVLSSFQPELLLHTQASIHALPGTGCDHFFRQEEIGDPKDGLIQLRTHFSTSKSYTDDEGIARGPAVLRGSRVH